jgi:hypothetical protein
VKNNQGKYHLVSLFMIPSVLSAYFLGGVLIGIVVTAVFAILILLFFKRN